MAGSIKWMVYTADDASEYAVLIDEGNGEAGGFKDYADGTTAGVLPRYFQMRYVNAVSASGVARKFYIADPADPLLTDGGTITVDSIAYAVSSRRGETARLPRAADSGQTDGDAT